MENESFTNYLSKEVNTFLKEGSKTEINKNITLQMQWLMPVIPANREAEAGELPEPRRRRLR